MYNGSGFVVPMVNTVWLAGYYWITANDVYVFVAFVATTT